MLSSEEQVPHIGLCTQNVLWSDAAVFDACSESGGNALMYALTERALQMVPHVLFQNPVDLQEAILDELYQYGRTLTGHRDLRKTFILNALVGVDNAAWLLYARQHNIQRFDDLIPRDIKRALAHHHHRVVSVPLVSYGVSLQEIVEMVDDGYFFFKIKLGQQGSQDEMVQKDIRRLVDIHKTIGHLEIDALGGKKIPYYFDANGRYQSKEALIKFLDHADRIGALSQIAILEEPFPEEKNIDVSDLPVRLAADESAHTDEDALIRIQMGYGAIALKPVAKTLSMSLKIAKIAHEQHIPCFCADLTVNPVLLEWNKNVAARLAPLPGFDCGVCETNGSQNYKRWPQLKSYHPLPNASWVNEKNGTFLLQPDYYKRGGGIFEPSMHYLELVK